MSINDLIELSYIEADLRKSANGFDPLEKSSWKKQKRGNDYYYVSGPHAGKRVGDVRGKGVKKEAPKKHSTQTKSTTTKLIEAEITSLQMQADIASSSIKSSVSGFQGHSTTKHVSDQMILDIQNFQALQVRIAALQSSLELIGEAEQLDER